MRRRRLSDSGRNMFVNFFRKGTSHFLETMTPRNYVSTRKKNCKLFVNRLGQSLSLFRHKFVLHNEHCDWLFASFA